MTTAARPTWEPARGGNMKGETDLGQLSKQVSTRDLPTQMTLKYRQDGQGKEDEYEMLKATHGFLINIKLCATQIEPELHPLVYIDIDKKPL